MTIDISAELFERAAWSSRLEDSNPRVAAATSLAADEDLDWHIQRSGLRFVGTMTITSYGYERKWHTFADGDSLQNVPDEHVAWFLTCASFLRMNAEDRARKEQIRNSAAKHQRMLRKQERELRQMFGTPRKDCPAMR